MITDKYGKKATSNTVTLSMVTPLQITKQPTSVTVASGATAKVSVAATGDGLSYLWYYADKGVSTFSASSVTTSSYSLTMSSARSGRRVYCVITDKYGKKATSNIVTLTMTTPLQITKQPTSVTVASGATAKVSVTATGDGLSYLWYYADKGVSTFSASSVTISSYSLTMSSARSGRRVYCVITDKYGKKATSNTVSLTMTTPLQITKQPTSVTVASGATAKVSVTAAGDGLSYRWYYADKGVTTFTASSVTTASYSLTMTAARSGRRVYCVITDKYGKKVTSNTVTLSMATPLKITRQPIDVAVASGEVATVSVSATGDELSYRWYYANKGSSTFSATSIAASSYSVAMSEARDGRRVYCVVTDKYGNTVTSDKATLSILESEFVPVTKVTLSISSPEEEYWVGDSCYGQLVKVYPDDATDTRVILSCSNPSVVKLSVDSYGRGSAEMIGVGTATITAKAVSPTTEGGSTYAVDTCTVTVIDPDATETVVDGSFNYSSATVTIGDKYYLKGTAEVSGSTLSKVTVNVLNYDVADYPASEVSKTFSGSTSSISLGSYSSTYVFDTSKAPFNTPGTYTLNLWVKAADGTFEKVDTMKLTTEAAEEETLPTLQALIGSTEYTDGSTYGPLANGGSDVLNLKAKVSNVRRVYLAIFDANGSQIDFIDDANGTECRYLEYAYSSLTTTTQNLYARIKAGTVPGNYTVKISVSDSSIPNDPNANKATLSFTLRIVASVSGNLGLANILGSKSNSKLTLCGSLNGQVDVGSHGTYKTCHDFTAAEGTPLYAPLNGNIVCQQIFYSSNGVDTLVSYGNKVTFSSVDSRFEIVFAHLSSFNGVSTTTDWVTVSENKRASEVSGLQKVTKLRKSVKKGELIGYTGNTGHSSGPHLHIEVYSIENGAYRRIYPCAFFKKEEIVYCNSDGSTDPWY